MQPQPHNADQPRIASHSKASHKRTARVYVVAQPARTLREWEAATGSGGKENRRVEALAERRPQITINNNSMVHPKLIEDQSGMIFEYLDEEEAEFLYEVRRYSRAARTGGGGLLVAVQFVRLCCVSSLSPYSLLRSTF